MTCKPSQRRILQFLIVTFILTLCSGEGVAATEKILHQFSAFPHGDFPGGLVADASGNFYGVARGGLYGAGVVFRLEPDQNGNVTQTVLYNFTGGLDGGNLAGIALDGAGNIYGFASAGGSSGNGTFFELSPEAHGQWRESVLYNFTDFRSEPFPNGPSIDGAGNIYGETYEWGPPFGYGFVFALMRSSGGVWSESVLYTFSGGADGGAPFGTFIFDHAGNLYGAAALGGSGKSGLVFELSPSTGGTWTETVLYNFAGGADGGFPEAGLIADGAGNFFGTTGLGGNAAGCGASGGCGTVFELKPESGGFWTESLLYTFGNRYSEIVAPSALTLDASGNLFGTTYEGGSGRDCYNGCGTVFELSPSKSGQWTANTLYNFTGAPGGYNPSCVVIGPGGRLFGSTSLGGLAQGFNGTIFSLTPSTGGSWTSKTVYNFPSSDGDDSLSMLIADGAGNLYGTTVAGGPYKAGTVFELSPTSGGTWKEQILYSFPETKLLTFPGGAGPDAGVVMDSAGNLYGTTVDGGANNSGTVFELSPNPGGAWSETVLYSFTNDGNDGQHPFAGLVFDAAGNLYGTTRDGGLHGWGTAFELTPGTNGGWTETVIHSFAGDAADGANPFAALIIDAAGNLYGTTNLGGSSRNCRRGCGTVFELSPRAGGSFAETVLYSFTNANGDGAHPLANLVFDGDGNFYGTTVEGGIVGDCSWAGLPSCGTVFELSPTGGGHWGERVLYAFTGFDKDGGSPVAGLVLDSEGNLYGTTAHGGNVNINQYPKGFGTVFEVFPTIGGGWTETVLHNFGQGLDGSLPQAGLLLDPSGNLYGTSTGGATTGSVVFEITP